MLSLYGGGTLASVIDWSRLYCYDYEELVVSTSAVGLTSSKLIPSGKNCFLVMVRLGDGANGINCRIDGTNPTSSVGIQGDHLWYPLNFNEAEKFKTIRSGGVDSKVSAAFYAVR